MTRLYTFLIVIIFACTKGFSQVLGFSLAEGRTKVQIPIEINNNLVVVPIVLNGALPLKFILDTGVRTAILTQKTFSDILNLSYSRKYSIAGPGGIKVVDAYITNNVSLELPGVLGRGHALLVLDQDYLELRNYLGTDVHGILGYELFSRFIVKIDYEKKILTLMLPERFKPNKKYQALPIRIEDTKPYLTTPVILADGTQLTAKLLVDSGASHGLMLDPASDSRISVPENTVSSVIGRGLGGEITGRVGRIDRLILGNLQLHGPITNFPDPNSYFDSLKVGSAQRNGAIGGEVLSRFTVVFNFPKEQIYLKKNSAFKKDFHYNLSGITIKAKGSRLNVFEVTEVRRQSVSDKAGVASGDIILTVNGISASVLTLNLINGFFNNKPGKKIKLLIERNGVKIRKEFRLEDQI
ncbi:aspartyl protease family protein [Chryseosolibacter indicus]|uniref:Aspartyl protease family protein n=1 Tax=Chryseosolibacter indicus TaxID=2782351 RepID=A0ABS5VSQ0_9BACT|nr:aspartyl protease family protein [Chryseosolibacter indicus]MBT1704216.1 aspartyl protease family protein [Chryseosolibacter indicus]